MKKTLITNLTFGAALLLSSFAHAAFVSNPCSTADVTVDESNAFLCAGSFEGNDSKDFDINTIFGEPLSDITWDEAAKVTTPTSETGDHHLEATAGTSGTWTYTGTDTLSSPFVIILKASSEYSAYLFKGIESAKTGTFLISFFTSNNEQSTPDLSHISIYSTKDDIPGGGTFGSAVPLPAALWLFGPALLGFMGFRKKTKS